MRSRNIKPGFFANEDLAELTFETRLLFIGTWCLADREGRLEDRPKRIKMELFPADSLDVDLGLRDLERLGFIERYEVDGVRYVQVVSFTKHQRPHKNESASVIPPNPRSLATMAQRTVNHGAANGEPWEQALRSDSLIPDSGLSDSLFVESQNSGEGERKTSSSIIRVTQVSEDFSLTDALKKWGEGKGFTVAQMQSQVGPFVDHNLAHGHSKRNWEAAFRSWMTRAAEMGKISAREHNVQESETVYGSEELARAYADQGVSAPQGEWNPYANLPEVSDQEGGES